MDHSPDYLAGWQAAIEAASYWHTAKAKQTAVLARRARFPKTLENEAALHERCAEELKRLSPDDV